MDHDGHIFVNQFVDRRHHLRRNVDAAVGAVPLPDIPAEGIAPVRVVQSDAGVRKTDPVIYRRLIAPLSVVLFVSPQDCVCLFVIGKICPCGSPVLLIVKSRYYVRLQDHFPSGDAASVLR